jgi:hypothetical protein
VAARSRHAILNATATASSIRRGQWNALRHGHYAYYSMTALTAMLAANGMQPRTSWQFDLYGGTVLLAASRADGGYGRPDGTVQSLLADDTRVGIGAPPAFSALQRRVRADATSLHDWLAAERIAGSAVLGYGAASRAVALLRCAAVDRTLLPAVVDISPTKQGRRMPGTDIPVVGPGQLTAVRPAKVLLFLADLMTEARDAFPEVEASGGQWVNIDWLSLGCRNGTRSHQASRGDRTNAAYWSPAGKAQGSQAAQDASQPAPSSELVLAASD